MRHRIAYRVVVQETEHLPIDKVRELYADADKAMRHNQQRKDLLARAIKHRERQAAP
jgi:hypothetical protein